MKRTAILQPLSREHHRALSLAKRCKQAALSGDGVRIAQACQSAVLAFSTELEPHFKIEEQTFLPLLKTEEGLALVKITLSDHRRLRALLYGLKKNDNATLIDFGNCLAAHVRFEEKKLFPMLEKFFAAQENF